MIYFELFYVFFYIGLLTFGGGYAMIPMIQDEIVSRGWISQESLTDFIAISEGTPGPFAINISTMVGSQTAGVLGAICATIGVVLPSFIIILLVAFIMRRILKNRFVKAGLTGVIPVIIALISSTAIIFFVKMILFGGHDLYSQDPYFDRASFAVFLILGAICILYKQIKKKSLNPIILLLIGAGLGLLVFEFFKF